MPFAALPAFILSGCGRDTFVAGEDLDKFCAALSAKVDSALVAPETAKSDAATLELARAELLWLVGVDSLKSVLKKENGAAFLENFLNNRVWLEKFLVSGPVDAGVPATEGLSVLCDLWNFDRAGVEGKFNSLATAVAVNYAAVPFRTEAKSLEIDPFRRTTPVDRYAFFRDADNAGRLDPMFDTLRTWELRFVVDAPLDNDALRWALDNVNVPLRDYPEAYTMNGYRRINAFGDSVHGPLYYMPWRATENRMISILKRGGVCGALSTFGATAAQAHGIPAYPVGQPGHCAYAVRIAPGKWTGGTFGAHAGLPLHYFWAQSTYYSVLMEEAFADDAKILDSTRDLWIARRAFGTGKFDAAENACLAAIAAQPANFDAWALRIDIAEKNPATTPADLQKIADDILAKLSNHMRPACDLLARFEGKLLAGKTPAEKIAWFTRVHETLSRTKGEISWHWRADDLLGRQVAQLPANLDDRLALFKKAVALHARTSDEFLGQLLDWGVKNLGGAEKSIEALAEVVSEGEGDINAKSAEKILGTAILASAKAKSLPAFQAAVKAADKYVQPTINFKLDRPEGLKIVSADGLLSTSTTTPWDLPLTHGNVLTEKGGLFHTAAQKTPSATVQLNGAKKLTGILIVNRDQYPARAKPLIVSTSTDGATWTKIWESNDVKPQWFIPLEGNGVKAVYVKVTSKHDVKDYFHLRAIVVYGE